MTATLLMLAAKGFATVLLTALLATALVLAATVAINPAQPLAPAVKARLQAYLTDHDQIGSPQGYSLQDIINILDEQEKTP